MTTASHAGPLKLVAVTACPAGIAHTYMAAEKLQQTAEAHGHTMKVETQGSIGVENRLSDADVAQADAVIIAADKEVDRSRFAGKPLVSVGVGDAIRRPEELFAQARTAAPYGSGGGAVQTATSSGGGKERSVVYKALMNGVSYMIPFVVVGGLLIAVAMAFGGKAGPDGMVIPDHTVWKTMSDVGALGFQLMVPILAGYIAYAIADRPGLAPGLIVGYIANTGSFYDSKSGTGFLGAIVAGFLVGYVALGIKKIKVPRAMATVMPIIFIPVLTTLIVGSIFIYVIGSPISWLFTTLTSFLSGLQGGSAAVLGIVLGAMIAFDMGGPVNKTAFLFGSGLIASGNHEVMGMVAAAIAVPPLGMGLATLLRKRLFDQQERDTGIAALFMGFFGITEGAIPFAAGRPAQVIPANMAGAMVAGGLGAVFAVKDSVPHGGPIVAVLGAVGGVPMYFAAIAAGAVVTAFTSIALIERSSRRKGARDEQVAGPVEAAAEAPVPVAAPAPADAPAGEVQVLSGYLTAETVKPELAATGKDEAIRELVALAAGTGRVADHASLAEAVHAREAQGSTGLGEGIAIPHAKTDAVTEPVVCFSRSSEGVEWGAPDGSKAKLLFLVAVPQEMAGDEHLRILAQLSRKLVNADFRDELEAAADRGEIVRTLEAVA
ncbi:PTS system fructose-specific IIC component [Streptacidiphilus sp. MAP12-20]|uniref:fructose-specific PTS transporter subunit EIIC n=1 Tax=Streptacidiphilus sp. MAP12-20 TaxID=3156299 RepID=UPI003514AAA9